MPKSKVSESRLWAWLSKARKHYGSDLHMCRVENGVIAGMPDMEGCLKGDQFWIELKCNARPARATTKIKPRFQPQQLPWLEKRAAAGGKVYVLLQVGSGHDATRYLVPGYNAHKLPEGLTEVGLQHCSVTNNRATAIEIIGAAAKYWS